MHEILAKVWTVFVHVEEKEMHGVIVPVIARRFFPPNLQRYPETLGKWRNKPLSVAVGLQDLGFEEVVLFMLLVRGCRAVWGEGGEGREGMERVTYSTSQPV